MREKKRHPFRHFLRFLVIVAVIWLFSTFVIKQTDATFTDSRIEGDVKIAVISDLHGQSFGKDNEQLIKKIDGAAPDFIAAVGDMYTFGDAEGEDTAAKLLTALAERYDVYYVSGEHDGNEGFLETLTDGGVRVMNYRDELVEYNGTVLHLYGIDNAYYSPTFDLANEFERDTEHCSVLLAHIPHFEAFSSFGIDLTLCGDTHGGQVRLPFIGGVYSNGAWLPELLNDTDFDSSCVKGMYTLNDKAMFVTSGLGNYPVPVRLFNRPEVAVVTLRSE